MHTKLLFGFLSAVLLLAQPISQGLVLPIAV